MSYRYIGNKTRLLPVLIDSIRELVPTNSVVADLMCGTASVSEALRVNHFRVIASDIMTFAAHHARVRLLLSNEPNFSQLGFTGYSDIQRFLNSVQPIKGFFFREYSPDGIPDNGIYPRKYFTSENAGKIDAISNQIGEWNSSGLLLDLENSLLRHDLVLATNRVANIAGTYGHHRSKWSPAALAPLELQRSNFLAEYRIDHIVHQGPAEEIASKVTSDLCYIDPPYMKRQYAANYHIIETLARGDNPEVFGVSGLRPWRDQYSNFCSKVKIRGAFREILTKVSSNQFLISYSEDGLLSEEELVQLFSEFGRVFSKKIPFPRFKSNSSGQGGAVNEFLFHIIRS